MANLNFGIPELTFLIVAAKNATIQGKDAVAVAKIITTLEKELEKASIPPEVAARKK